MSAAATFSGAFTPRPPARPRNRKLVVRDGFITFLLPPTCKPAPICLSPTLLMFGFFLIFWSLSGQPASIFPPLLLCDVRNILVVCYVLCALEWGVGGEEGENE